MAANPDKKFYLETFGCQMNAHDSEKVVGTLLSEGYQQVPTVEEAELVLYNTCSIRDKAEQKVFHRLADYKKLEKQGKALRRARLRGPAGRRKDFRARAARVFGLRLGVVPESASKCWCRSRQGSVA